MSVSSSHGFALLALVLGVALIFAGIVGSDSVEANRIAVPVAMLRALPLQPSPLGSPVAAVATERTRVVEAEVRRGDTLSIIFGRSGLSQASLRGILDADVKGQVLQDIHPGQVFRFTFGDKAELLEFEYRKSPLQRTVYRKSGDDYRAEVLTRTPEVRRAFRHAIVKRSLYEAGQDAGISSRMILELANVLGGVMDFALDPSSGDSFSVLYEEQYLDGERIAEGAIIAVEYVNEGRHHTAFRFVDSQGYAGYFGADGVSMRKAFLRAPLDFTRVSSNFNMRRFHPIARVIRPHRGVDYAAPTGTPVYASGDGRVIEAGYSRGNGNYVYLQHDGRIVTRYLHLHKRLVKLGQRVSQGQSIGSVGATGLATGPHLHYEFLVDGAYRNPRTALDKLPRARTLDGAEIARFAPEAAKLASTIANYSVAWELAVANSEP